MEESRFESLRHALAAVSPRRGLMSLLGGLTLGGSLPAVLSADDAQAKKVRGPKKKKKAKAGPAGPPGSQGPAGPLGPQGLQGPAGSITCPDGTLLHEGVCIETSNSNGGSAVLFAAAQSACLGDGRRLPTVAEMQTFRNRGGTDFSHIEEFTNHVWTDSNDAGTLHMVQIISSNGIPDEKIRDATFARFRCVATPS
jgi:hypothetical protein